MITELDLQVVEYMPRELKPGILYISDEYDLACHMCPCGCGNKIVTPIGPTDWSFKLEKGKPTLYPSIGNWQIPCRSHYWIRQGIIEWSYQWSEKRIKAGREHEEKRRESYYKEPAVIELTVPKKTKSKFARFIGWLFRKR